MFTIWVRLLLGSRDQIQCGVLTIKHGDVVDKWLVDGYIWEFMLAIWEVL